MVLGDPCGGDGGGRGRSQIRDWSEGRQSRSMLERRRVGNWRGESRSMLERRRVGNWRGKTRRNLETDKTRIESRSNEGHLEPVIPDLPCVVSHKTQGNPRGGGGGGRGSVAWRRIRDSHWRRTGQWLDADIKEEVPESSGALRVPEPIGNLVSPELPWRPWEQNGPTSDQDLSQTITRLQTDVSGSHKAKDHVERSIPLENCPSSNLHHFVEPVPHTSHEVYAPMDIRTKNPVFEGKPEC